MGLLPANSNRRPMRLLLRIAALWLIIPSFLIFSVGIAAAAWPFALGDFVFRASTLAGILALVRWVIQRASRMGPAGQLVASAILIACGAPFVWMWIGIFTEDLH